MQNTSLVSRLLSYRLQWYRIQMLEKLIRFKHVVVILIGLFIAPLNLFDALFVQPIINIGYAKNPSTMLIFSLLLTQGIYLSWIIFQDDAISTARVRQYFNALPIPPIKHYIADITTLFLANNIFWIPIIAALINAPYASMTNPLAPFLFVIKILVLIISIFAIQTQWIYRQYFSFTFLISTNFLFYISSITTSPWLSLLLIICALLNALLFTYPWRLKINILSIFSSASSTNKSVTLPRYSRFQLLKLTYTVLIKKYFVECFMRCALSIAILIFGCFAILFGDSLDARLWSVSLLSIVALTFSGFFPLLKESREQYKLYLHALPISQSYWYMLDYSAIALLIIFFWSLYATVLMIYQKLNLLEVAWIVASSSILALILCCIRNRYRKFNALFSIIATVAWVTLISYR